MGAHAADDTKVVEMGEAVESVADDTPAVDACDSVGAHAGEYDTEAVEVHVGIGATAFEDDTEVVEYGEADEEHSDGAAAAEDRDVGAAQAVEGNKEAVGVDNDVEVCASDDTEVVEVRGDVGARAIEDDTEAVEDDWVDEYADEVGAAAVVE